MTTLQKISMLPEIENWVFSLSESEVEHKLMLHWISAQFFALDSVLFSPLHIASYIWLFLYITKQSTKDNCETDGYFSQRFANLWKVDLWLEGLWFEFRSKLKSEEEIVSSFSVTASQMLTGKKQWTSNSTGEAAHSFEHVHIITSQIILDN